MLVHIEGNLEKNGMRIIPTKIIVLAPSPSDPDQSVSPPAGMGDPGIGDPAMGMGDSGTGMGNSGMGDPAMGMGDSGMGNSGMGNP
jgi:hypothetical protein